MALIRLFYPFPVARFDFSWLDVEYHQETVDNLRKATKNVKRLCAVSHEKLHFFYFVNRCYKLYFVSISYFIWAMDCYAAPLMGDF